MIDLKRILVPLDFSKASLNTLEHAVRLADHFDAKLIVTHVVAPLPHYVAVDGGMYSGIPWPSKADIEVEAREHIDGLVEKLDAERSVEHVILHGDPGTEIAKFTRESAIDMVMMPTHGYGPFRRFVLGSVTAKVLHDVSCPVFTGVHIPEVIPFKPAAYRRIACAVDESEHSQAVLEWAWGFAQTWEADLMLIHAAPRVRTSELYADWCPPDLQATVVESARRNIAKLVQEVGCEAEVHVDFADPATYVGSVVEEGQADVLVIGRSLEERFLGRLFTHAYALIRGTPCPVISV